MSSFEFSLKSSEFSDIPIVQSTPAEATREICKLAKSWDDRPGQSFHFVNAYTIALAHGIPQYGELLRTSTANFPDGRPLTWWKLRNGKRPTQIRGPQLFEDVMDRGRDFRLRHFLLGSSEETLQLLVSSLCQRYPGIEIVGTYSPPFRSMSAAEINEQDRVIEDSDAEIVWVGLGTPKQDWEVARLATRLPTINIAVGAAFDFSAGTKKVSPHWMSSLGLEWLFRLATEPRRLWKRYLIGNLVFLRAVTRHLVANNHQSDRIS